MHTHIYYEHLYLPCISYTQHTSTHGETYLQILHNNVDYCDMQIIDHLSHSTHTEIALTYFAYGSTSIHCTGSRYARVSPPGPAQVYRPRHVAKRALYQPGPLYNARAMDM